MRLRSLVWKELRERPSALVTSGLAIVLGVAALVAIRHVTVHSEGEVNRQLASLGANILVLPKGASLQNYYAADNNGQMIPEEHVSEIYLAGLTGVEKLSPKLSVPTKVGAYDVTLTGILPQSEFQTKAAWQTVGMFAPKKHDGCKKMKTAPTAEDLLPEALAHARTIENLKEDEVVIGADVAERTALFADGEVKLYGETIKIIAVLPPTGTVDDGRIFGHLHTVQRLTNSGENVSAIEVMGCCEDAAGDLVHKLAELLPNTKVVTISQVVQTQVGVNRLMANTSWFVLAVVVAVGGMSLAGAVSANVRERRREIGTLMALGATPGFVSRLFLLKALWLGLAGGVLGCVLGMAIAVGFGPQWAGVEVQPLPGLSALAVAAAAAVALAAAYLPARRAAQLDPCVCFQEI